MLLEHSSFSLVHAAILAGSCPVGKSIGFDSFYTAWPQFLHISTCSNRSHHCKRLKISIGTPKYIVYQVSGVFFLFF